jgi:hypothetical protein
MFTNREKNKEALREVDYRRFVYSKRIGDGKMTQADADRKIAKMVEIAEDYRKLAEADEMEDRLL